MPIGLVGLMIAAIFAAAMSSDAAELNSLATATIIDFYRRHFGAERPIRTICAVSKLATAFWGLFACVVAIYAASSARSSKSSTVSGRSSTARFSASSCSLS